MQPEGIHHVTAITGDAPVVRVTWKRLTEEPLKEATRLRTTLAAQ